MASLNSGGNQSGSGSSYGSRLKRPGTTTAAAAGTSRIPPRRVQGTSRSNNQGTNAGASRSGSGGVRKLAGKLVMKRMAERLPLRYRDEVIISRIMLVKGDGWTLKRGMYVKDLFIF